MSLWTPDGERPVSRTSPQSPSAPGGQPSAPTGRPSAELREALSEAGIDIDQLTPEQQADAAQMLQEMAQVREQMLSVPAADIVANHLMGIYELAAIHLGENPPNFEEATVAIESVRVVLERIGDKFGENEAILRQALTQLQMTFVQLKEQVTNSETPAP